MFGLIRKSSVQAHIDNAVIRVSETLGKMFDAEKKKIYTQHEDKITFLLAEKDAEINEYCRQNSMLRDIIAQMERDKEDVKQGAIENARIANNIDKVAKNILDTTEKIRMELVQSISGEFKKYFETLALHWQTTSEIINDSRTHVPKWEKLHVN